VRVVKNWGEQMKWFFLLIVISVASLSGFIIHVFSAEWLQSWIASQMSGIAVEPSWNVRDVALVSSIEYGVSALAIYYLLREKIHSFNFAAKILLLSTLLISIHGALIRQPLLDYVIGNPLHVVVVQNTFKWLVWILMSAVVVTGFEMINSRYGFEKK